MSSVIIFIIGLIFGSFLNMLIYRLPLGISLINPKRSICTSCETQIKWYENIPLFSYVFLKGKCSSCNNKISVIYPIVELLTAIITLLLFFSIGFNLQFILTVILFYILIALSFIDFKYKAVPDYLLIVALVMTIIIVSIFEPLNLSTMLMFAGAFVFLELFITFYIQNIKAKILNDDSLKTQRSMGEGDIPIAAIIGGILGIKLGLFAIFLSALFAIIPSLLNNFIKKDIETPFIPYLSLGLFVVFINKTYFLNLLGEIML